MEWPEIAVGVDDSRPARMDEVEYCSYCNYADLEGELMRLEGDRGCLKGELRCAECVFSCPACGVYVYGPGEFCNDCSLMAMGVEL